MSIVICNPVGMNFQEWCKLDEDDERIIHYSLSGIMDGKMTTLAFASSDLVDGIMLFRVQNSTIVSLSLVDNEWFVELSY